MNVTADEKRIQALRERYPDEDFEAIDVTVALGRANFVIEQLLARELKQFDLTPVGAQVLISVLVADGGPIDLTTLAGQVRVTKANVSLVLVALEKRGLVERVPEPTDGRRIRVRLTRRGRNLVKKLIPLTRDTMETALSEILARERAQLRKITRRIEWVP